MLFVRRHAGVIVTNARTDLAECFDRVDDVYKGKLGYDSGRRQCVNKMKESLDKQVPIMNTMYDGYMKNFNTADGSLL